MEGPLFELLYKCVVRLIVPNGQGTGFFVAPGSILTCAHVVDEAKNDASRIIVRYRNEKFKVESIKFLNKPYPDLALLRIDLDKHPCVYLDSQIKPSDKLYAYGFTSQYPGGDSAIVEYEGPARFDDKQWFLKFKGGQIIPGYSGSPLLNTRTWSVCGVVKSTRDRITDLGGAGIPTEVVLAELPELTNLQEMFHNWDTDWAQARKQQIDQMATLEPGLQVISINVQPVHVLRPSPMFEVECNQLEPRQILEKLYSPLSVDWYAEDRIVLGSRDGYLRVWGMDGHIHKTIPTTGYPNYVAVYNQRRLAALCYTKLYLVDIETDEVRFVEIDPNAGSYIVRWSPKGEYIAVGATNMLKIFNVDLTLLVEHHVGGKYGATALTWDNNGDLYAGLGNGELWLLKEPFDTPAVLIKGSSPLRFLQSSGIDDRIACLWQDGNLEIRKGDTVLNSMIIKTTDVWIPSGPKLVWCINHMVLACTTGLSNELVFWQFDSNKALSCRFERKLLAIGINPSKDSLAIGMDEQQTQDAEVLILPLSKVSAVLAKSSIPAQKKIPEAHLLSADWNPLIDLIEDKRKGIEASYTVRLDIPLLKNHFDNYEESIRKSDAEKGILRSDKRYLKTARQNAEGILDDLLWITMQMRETGYYERDISVVCDRVVSFAVNKILGRLGIKDYPKIESLEEFVAFTLGYNRDELLYLGFDAYDDGGTVAEVPIDFLMNVEKLVSMGEILGSQYGMTTLKQKVIVGCQLFHEFDYAFDYYQQKELWILFVLPLSVVCYSRENVIIHPSDVKSYGLA